MTTKLKYQINVGEVLGNCILSIVLGRWLITILAFEQKLCNFCNHCRWWLEEIWFACLLFGLSLVIGFCLKFIRQNKENCQNYYSILIIISILIIHNHNHDHHQHHHHHHRHHRHYHHLMAKGIALDKFFVKNCHVHCTWKLCSFNFDLLLIWRTSSLKCFFLPFE